MSAPWRTALALGAGVGLGLLFAHFDRGEKIEPRTSEAADASRAAERARPAGEAEVAALVAAHEQERVAWETERDAFETEHLRLVGELENALAERVARESEFIEFTSMLSSIVPDDAPPEVYALFGTSPPVPEPEPVVEPSDEERALAERTAALTRQIKAMLVTERLDSLELLTGGVLGDGFLGPVVFRTLDERGRPIGSLVAERLRLEGSRVARTVTIVLEEGYERDGTSRTPFPDTPPGVERGGVRRILLQQTNPGPWFESCPELFDPEALEMVRDDGTWRVYLVHRALNQLLESDTGLGYFRVAGIGGIVEAELRGVEIEQLDRAGKLIKRLFADRVSIALVDRGVQMTLRDGVQVRGGRKHDFLGGRYRIFLPGADHATWTAAGIPGLVPNAKSPLASMAAR